MEFIQSYFIDLRPVAGGVEISLSYATLILMGCILWGRIKRIAHRKTAT